MSVPRTDLEHRLNSKSDHRGAISNYTLGHMLFPVDIWHSQWEAVRADKAVGT